MLAHVHAFAIHTYVIVGPNSGGEFHYRGTIQLNPALADDFITLTARAHAARSEEFVETDAFVGGHGKRKARFQWEARL